MALWTILCKTKDGKSPSSFGYTLDTSTSKWTIGGPAAARVSKTKAGKFDFHVIPTAGTSLFGPSGKSPVVAILDNLNGGSNVGDKGTGKQEETPITFDWELQSK